MKSQSKFQRKTDKWTVDTIVEVFDLYRMGFDKAYMVGCLLARAEDKALRRLKRSDVIPGFIQKAAAAELNLRQAERRAERYGTYRIS